MLEIPSATRVQIAKARVKIAAATTLQDYERKRQVLRGSTLEDSERPRSEDLSYIDTKSFKFGCIPNVEKPIFTPTIDQGTTLLNKWPYTIINPGDLTSDIRSLGISTTNFVAAIQSYNTQRPLYMKNNKNKRWHKIIEITNKTENAKDMVRFEAEMMCKEFGAFLQLNSALEIHCPVTEAYAGSYMAKPSNLSPLLEAWV